MIYTPLGIINIYVNNQFFKYGYCKLPTETKVFEVDGRYQIVISNLEDDMTVDFILETQSLNQYIIGRESGQDLELISFRYDNLKLSIGVEGDIKGFEYQYKKSGIQIKVNELYGKKQLLCNVAWVYLQEPDKENAYCWFAADPTIH